MTVRGVANFKRTLIHVLCNFSERSKRRVEVAYQAIDDDHADQIAQVGERAFEEILREVSLI